MKCYSCSNDAVRECRRCGRLYCDEHGDELCGECMKPSGALPSFLLYRGSLLALLLATAVALWLLLKPPQEKTQSAPVVVQPTATAQPASTNTPAVVATPTVAATPTATPGALEYTVQEGDSLLDIAAQFLPPDQSITDFANAIAAANGIDPADPLLQPGQVLRIPQ